MLDALRIDSHCLHFPLLQIYNSYKIFVMLIQLHKKKKLWEYSGLFFFTVQKMKLPVDLVTFTEEILNGKFHFFLQCSIATSLSLGVLYTEPKQYQATKLHNFGPSQKPVLTKLRMEEPKRSLLTTSFSPVTSTNVGIRPQNFLDFSFKPLATLCKTSNLYLVPAPNYLTWTKSAPQKNRFFRSNPYDFSHRNARITKLWSHDLIYSIIWFTF